MAFSKEFQEKLDRYEQIYYSLDKPVPFKGGLSLHPVLVKDYYRFYSCFGLLTMDKTTKPKVNENGEIEKDQFGHVIKETNLKGLGQSYLAYLLDTITEERYGQQMLMELIELMELVFHVEKGLFCPNCGKEITYESFFKEKEDYMTREKAKVKDMYVQILKEDFQKNNPEVPEEELPDFSKEPLPEAFERSVEQNALGEFLTNHLVCPDCGEKIRDKISIKEDENTHKKTLMIKNIEINSNDFEELKAIVPRQNILDYDADKYIDPELKEELDLKATMQNKDYTAPTLEKQLLCVAVGTGYSLEYLQTLTMRKLSYLLRIVDRKSTYYAQLQASMSGFVEFKTPPEHWIFSEDKKNIAKELTSVDDFTKKFDMVT